APAGARRGARDIAHPVDGRLRSRSIARRGRRPAQRTPHRAPSGRPAPLAQHRAPRQAPGAAHAASRTTTVGQRRSCSIEQQGLRKPFKR
ncbi:hypothetical protein DWV00_31120, partial [Trinickia dinghuensis]